MDNRFKFTEDNPLRVFTAFSGYDSQCKGGACLPYPDARTIGNLCF